MGRALEDVTVVSFAQLAQGPVAAQMLGDLGAEVIKIERPGGEWIRDWDMANAYPGGEGAVFLSFNRNKRSIELDLKDDDQREVAYELVEEADVLVENFRPGVMDRLGFGYEELSERNPGLVYCSATGWGSEGPYADRAGQDLVLQGVSGIAAMNGRRDDPPTPVAVSVVDLFSAANLAFAALAALHYRDRTGSGQHVEGSLLSAALGLLMQEVSVYTNAGIEPERSEAGIAHPYNQAPFAVYETRDGHITISLNPPAAVGEALDIDEIEDVDDWEEAYERRDEIKRIIEEELRTDTTEHWLETLWEHDIWCGPVNDLPDALDHPQVEAEDVIQRIDHPGIGTLDLVRIPVQFSATPPELSRHPPAAGEHTEEILRERGYSRAEIDAVLDRD